MLISRFACAFVLAVPVSCLAQATAPGQQVLELSLEKAIAIASNRSTSVQLAQESVHLAHSHNARVRADLLPNLDTYVAEQDQTVNLRALGLRFQTPGGFVIPERVGPFNTFDARMTLHQTVLDFSSIRRTQASHQDVQAAAAGSDAVLERIAGAVAKLYAAALLADANLETAKANVSLAQALRDLARNRASVGKGTDIEVTRANLSLARDQQRLMAAETERTDAYLDLINALNVDWNTELHLTGKLGSAPQQPYTPEQAVALALERRSDFREQQKRMESARLTHSAAVLERLPSIVGYADYGVLSGVWTHTAGVSLRLPLFDGGRQESDRAESRSLVRQEEIKEKELKNSIELEIRKALASLGSTEQQVQVSEQAAALAEDELARARRRYEAGLTSSLEVVDAETGLEAARGDRVAALFNFTNARIALAQAMGTIKTISF